MCDNAYFSAYASRKGPATDGARPRPRANSPERRPTPPKIPAAASGSSGPAGADTHEFSETGSDGSKNSRLDQGQRAFQF